MKRKDMPLRKAQHEERLARRQAATEAANKGLILVQRNGWYGIFNSEYGDVVLISRDETVAKRVLAARRRDDPNWRDM
jgi:hypothetical protein